MEFIRGFFGIFVLVLVAFLFSANRKKIDWRLVAIGISLQLVFGFLITQVEVVKIAFQFLSEGFVKFLSFSEAGARFIFGDLAGDSFGFIFAFTFSKFDVGVVYFPGPVLNKMYFRFIRYTYI